MITYRKLTLGTLVIGLLALLTPNTQAAGTGEKMRVTFSKPVELPGVVLPAGTYIFEALEDGQLTRVLSADNQHVYANLFTVPDEHREPAGKGDIILGGRMKGSPERIREWVYPGDSVGKEFMYQKTRSGRDAASIVGEVTRESGRFVADMGKGVATSTEFLAVHVDHIVVRPIGHLIRAVV